MLKAPPEICGWLNRYSDDAIRQKRIKWIALQFANGHRQTDIARAIGVGHGSISEMCRRYQVSRPERTLNARRSGELGVRPGRINVHETFDALPSSIREKLFAQAAKSSATLSEVMRDVMLTALFKEYGDD